MNTIPAARPFLIGVLALCASVLPAANTWYVSSTTGNDSGTGSSTSPFKTILAGVNKALAGDTVLVAPGTYNIGETGTSSTFGRTRVAITKSITVRSTQGAEKTLIVGQYNSTTAPFGSGSIRCVYMTDGTLDGFTLANGFANASLPPSNKDNPTINGGGVLVPVGNRAPQVNNCIITRCAAYRGGGAYWGTLNNCTVVSNYVFTTSGDGVWGSLVRNSIVTENGDENYSSAANSVDPTVFQYSCTSPAPGPGIYQTDFTRDGGNNITNAPLFLAGTLKPATNSPCLNAGNNAFASGPRDAAGSARIIGGVVDIGAYESTFVAYPLTVVNGTGSGNYQEGSVVPITANATNDWTVFTCWTGNVAAVSNVLSASTSVTMPAAPVTVVATYYAMTLGDILSEVLDIPQPVTSSNVTTSAISVDPTEVRLGPVADGDMAFVGTVYTNAGTLIFPWRVSSEPTYDRLILYVDGVEVAAISGTASGVVTQFVAGAGAHPISWVYRKDSSDFDGQDCGWVGAVTWIPDNLAAELGVPGRPIAFPYGKPGDALPFPYGFAGCFLDASAPSGAIGSVAAKLGGITNGLPLVADGHTNGTEVVLNGAGQLSFQWCTSSQASDYLLCYIDGVEVGRISGTKDGWKTFVTNLLTVGAHTVRWAYAKNASGMSGLDCGWIDSVTWNQFAYVLTVQNGTGNGAAVSTNAVGDTVALVADAPPAGQVFDVWDGDTATLVDTASPTTTLVMPGRDITVRALYKVKTLGVSVINGRDAGAWPNEFHESTGEPEGVYPAGALVRIVADPAPLWQTFDHWTNSVPVVFSNAFADVSMFVMPTTDVVVTAVYRPQTDAEKLAGALTIRGQPLTISAFSPSGVVAEATGGIRYDDPVVKMGGPSVGPNQTVSMTTTNFTGDGFLFFWWHGDAEADYDGVRLEVNGYIPSRIYSEKATNGTDKTVWWLYGFPLQNVSNITWRFTRDESYYIHNNMVLVDRVTWIPRDMFDALGAGACVPNINHEYDPLFLGRNMGDGAFDWEGEDGGVTWVHDAPGGVDALRLGAFGYVTNGLLAQVAITNYGTGLLTWNWRTRSESSYDFLEFLMDGSRTNWISGKGDGSWHTSGFFLANDSAKTREDNLGTKRIFGFRYKKDADVSVFEDCGWMRDVVWTPTFALQMIKGTNTAYTLQSPYDSYARVVSEAQNRIFPAGTLVTILADAPEAGLFFERWIGDGVDALLGADVSNPNPTFAMPSRDITITATYTDVVPPTPAYSLTVNNGTGSGNYTNGTVVAIGADPGGEWSIFLGWTGDIASVADPSAKTTTVVVVTNSMTVTANYTTAPVNSIIQFVLDLPNAVTSFGVPVENIQSSPPRVWVGPVDDSQTAYVETTINGEGTVIFPWSVDSEEGYDFLTFSIDGVQIASISGVASATVTNFISGDVTHTLRWAYTKDVSDSAGEDHGSVGTVIWIPNALAAEFGVPGKPLYLPNGMDSIILDYAPPAGAVSNIAAKLGAPTPVDNESETSVEAAYYGAGLLSFQWRVSSELNHDFLVVTIDGLESGRISGTKGGWSIFQTNLLRVAAHTVRWTYVKDRANTAGSDCGWVDSVTWTQFSYLLTVQNGSGSGSNTVGATVGIVADPAPAGYEFEAWDGDTETIADVTSPVTTLVMPGRDLTVRAHYKPQTLDVRVIKGRDAGAWPNAYHESTGEGEGSYPANTYVRIVADDPPTWQAFDHWVSTNGAVFLDPNANVTWFTMPTNDVTVEALYRPQSEAEKLAGALTIKGQPLLISSFSSTGVVAEATGGVRYNDPVVKFGGPAVGPSQYSELTITNFNGDGVLLFWMSCSSEFGYDTIEVYCNGSFNGSTSGPKCGRWVVSTNFVTGASSLTIRFARDDSYFVRDNAILVDRVMWIPRELMVATGFSGQVPNINGEVSQATFDGEDGGVSWVTDAPGGQSAIRFGRFGYVNNSQHAQLMNTNASTGVLMWYWAASSEAEYDSIRFFVDGSEPDVPRRMSGKEMSWDFRYWAITNLPSLTRPENVAIKHDFRFDYSKDEDVSVFNDCTWLRNGVWTPTSKLSVNSATMTFGLHWPFNTMWEIWQEARVDIFPMGTTITNVAEPAGSGVYFDRWAGTTSALNPGDVTNSTVIFPMPGYDTELTATYTSTPPSPSPSSTKQSRITGFSMVPAATAAAGGAALSSAALPSMAVVLSFDGAAQTDYEVLFSPALTGPDCVWQTLPVTYTEAFGDTADGKRMLRMTAEAPADAAQGFFRIQPR